MQFLTSQDTPVTIQTAWSVNDVISIADMEGENLDMTICQIDRALNFAASIGIQADESTILETVKQAHQALKNGA
jgi:mevalonate kinase